MDAAPRCFQTAFAYGEKNAVCLACPCVAECAPVAMQKRAEILRDVGAKLTAKRNETASEPIGDAQQEEIIVKPDPIEPTSAQVEKPTVTKAPKVAKPAGLPAIEGVSKKGMELIRAINKVTPNLRKDIKAGRNPFENAKPGFMKVVCLMLLAGDFHKKQLFAAFKEQLGWTDGSASSHVAMVASALPALGFVRVDNEVFKVEV